MSRFIRNYKNSFISLNFQVRMMLFIYMIQCISAGVAFFIAIYLDIHLSIDPETIGLLVSLFAGGNLIGSLLSAKILDASNPYVISFYSLLLQGLSFMFIALHPSVSSLALAMFSLGVSGYAYVVSSEFLILNASGQFEENRSKALGFINVSSNMGIGIGGVLVSFLSKAHPSALLLNIGCLLLLLSIYYLLENDKRARALDKPEPAQAVVQASHASGYYLSLVIIFFLGLIFAQQRVSYSLYLEQNFGDTAVSSLLLTNSVLIILFLPSITHLSAVFNKFTMMGTGAFLLGGGMFFYQFTTVYFMVFIICVIITFGEMLGTLFSQLVCYESARAGHKGKAMGFYKFLYALGTILGTSIGGAIQYHYGINYVWSFCGVLGALAILASIRPFKKLPPPQYPLPLS